MMEAEVIVTVSHKRQGIYRDKVYQVDGRTCLAQAKASYKATKGAYRVQVWYPGEFHVWTMDARNA